MHTTTGFRIARDILLDPGDYFKPQGKKKDPNNDRDYEKIMIWRVIETGAFCFRCELYDVSVEKGDSDQPCVVRSMRAQLVILEALGKFYSSQGSQDTSEKEIGEKQKPSSTENSRYWSRHTNSAQWVCGQVVGVERGTVNPLVAWGAP